MPSMVETAEEVRILLEKEGIYATLVNARFARPLDDDCIIQLAKNHELIVTLEENIKSAGIGEHAAALLYERQRKVKLVPVAISDQFVPHGSVEILKKELGLDAVSIAKKIMLELETEK